MFVFTPGNHDCDFRHETDTRAMAISHLESVLGTLDPAGDIVSACVVVQDNFFSFAETFTGTAFLKAADRLFADKMINVHGTQLCIRSINTAWVSQFHEVRGQLAFPMHVLPARRSQQSRTDSSTSPPRADLASLIDSLKATQHVLEMFRRSLAEDSPRPLLGRLARRLAKILAEAARLTPPQK